MGFFDNKFFLFYVDNLIFFLEKYLIFVNRFVDVFWIIIEIELWVIFIFGYMENLF